MFAKAVPFVVLALVVAAAMSFANDWPLTRPARRWWERHGGFVRWYMRSAPATFTYLAILGVTTWVLLGMPDPVRLRFIEAQSTNLDQLDDQPIRVLVRSAFFVTNGELLAWLALFALVLAPVERWLGSGRTIVVFVIGHVGATLLAALDVWFHIHHLHAPPSLAHVPDTGASYGFLTLAALLVYRVRGRSRIVLGLVLACIVVYGAIEGTGFTARGHAMAVLIGLSLVQVTRNPDVRARAGGGASFLELWRPPRARGFDPSSPTCGACPYEAVPGRG